MSYRRQEYRYWVCLRVFYVTFTITLVALIFVCYWKGVLILWIVILNALTTIVFIRAIYYFTILTTKMKKKHNYEYRKSRNTMLAFTGIAAYYYLMGLSTTYNLFYGNERYDFNVKHLKVYPT